MVKPLSVVAVLGVVGCVVAMSAGSAQAQGVRLTSPLVEDGEGPSRAHRSGRIQLVVPSAGATLAEPYAPSLLIGIEASGHLSEFFGVGVWATMANFGGAFSLDTDATSGLASSRNRVSVPDPLRFSEQVARLAFVASAELLFTPLRAEVSFPDGSFLDLDLFLIAGAALVGVEERADSIGVGVCSTDSEECRASQLAREFHFVPSPMLGVGVNIYLFDGLGISLEWRAFPYETNVAGTDDSGLGRENVVGAGFPDGRIDAHDRAFGLHHALTGGLVVAL